MRPVEGAAVKPRPRHELVMRVIHPLTRRGVSLLARTGVEPWQVVVAHSLLGLVAALLVAGSSHVGWLAAAVLLQLKTVLDNLDGGLARATNRVTELGRYLDTGLDLLVNVALFVALAWHGSSLLAAFGFVVLTLILSFDHNAEKLYRAAFAGAGAGDWGSSRSAGGQGHTTAAVAGDLSVRVPGANSAHLPGHPTAAASPTAAGPALRFFRGLYRVVLAPQDAAITWLDARLFRVASGKSSAAASSRERQAWNDLLSTAALVNFGLSTQYVALGVCLAAAAPFAYVYLVLAQGVYVVVVQLIRVRTYRLAAVSRPLQRGGGQ